MADLAALGRAHAAGLTGGVRREVVVVHVALAGLRTERVDLLRHLDHVESGDAHDLGLATLEQGRAVRARDDLDLGGQGADVPDATAVDTEVIGQDALAHDRLGERLEGRPHLAETVGEALGELLENGRLECVGRVVALLLVGDLHDLTELGLGDLGDRRVGVVLVRREQRELARGAGRGGGQRLLGGAQLGDERLGGLEAPGHDVLCRCLGATGDLLQHVLGGLCLDHHDRDVGGVP